VADINQWSETDSSNNSASPVGFPEGMAPSGVNDSARAVMGAVRRLRDQLGPGPTSGGSANAQTLTYSVARGSYQIGDRFVFIAGFTNTAAATLNVDALGAISIVTNDGVALQGGEIQVGQIVDCSYDGTFFRIENLNRQSVHANGYVKLLGGLILQWGSAAFVTANTSAVTFPTTFPNAVFIVLVSVEHAAGLTLTAGSALPATTGFTFNLSAAATTNGRWFAIGY
jgi:hypothetical protein